MCSVGFVNSGYRYGSLTELAEVPGTALYGSLGELTQVPGRYTHVIPVPVPASGYLYKAIPVPRVLWRAYTELTEVPGTGNIPGMVLHVPYSTQPSHLTEVRGTGMKVIQNLQKVQGTGMEVFQNSQKFRVGIRSRTRTPGIVPRVYRTYTSSRMGNTRQIPRAWFCSYPTEHNQFSAKLIYGYSPCNRKCPIFLNTKVHFFSEWWT